MPLGLLRNVGGEFEGSGVPAGRLWGWGIVSSDGHFSLCLLLSPWAFPRIVMSWKT